ncbi:MAG: hypothetical protein U1F77_09200 [Kiritimatiellia bacterium]
MRWVLRPEQRLPRPGQDGVGHLHDERGQLLRRRAITVNAFGNFLLLNRNVGWDAGNAQTIGTGNITVSSGAVVRNGTDHSIWGGHQNTRTVTVNGGTVTWPAARNTPTSCR